MSTSAAVVYSLLQRAFGGQARNATTQFRNEPS